MKKVNLWFLVLFWGINVGGKKVIVKEDFKKCFEDFGLVNVWMYI